MAQPVEKGLGRLVVVTSRGRQGRSAASPVRELGDRAGRERGMLGSEQCGGAALSGRPQRARGDGAGGWSCCHGGGARVLWPQSRYRGRAGWCLSCVAGEAALQVVASVSRCGLWGMATSSSPWVVSAVAVLWPQGRHEPRKSWWKQSLSQWPLSWGQASWSISAHNKGWGPGKALQEGKMGEGRVGGSSL